ncbi:MAG: hypothetical protein K0Q79_2457 [Flavipsychrobacter sp.]|nr:hypothetical protein [Flavipsychrobacter sp.]
MSAQTIQHKASTQPKGQKVLAEIISYIFHPVFFPLLMALALYAIIPAAFAHATGKQVGLWFISIAFTGVFFPLFSIALMKPLGFISSFKMETARERTIPLMATMIFYFWVSHVFNNIPGNPPLALKVLLLGNLWGIILVFLINIFTKISMHTSIAGGMLGIVFVLMMIGPSNAFILPLIIVAIIALIIGWARTVLGAHQRGDIWLGYIIGILVQLGAYVYMK